MDLIKTGSILCNKCQTNVFGHRNCPSCGHDRCYVAIYWKGKHYYYRRDKKGNTLGLADAILMLSNINKEIEHCKEQNIPFDPKQHTDSAIKERCFEIQYEKYLAEKKNELDANELSPEHYSHIKGYNKNQYKYFHGMDVKDMQKRTLAEFKNGLVGSVKTKRNVLNNLHHFFSCLFDDGIIDTMPIFPTVRGNDARRTVALRPYQQDEALENIPVDHRDIITFMMKTGLRHGEVISVLARSVDIDNRVVWVERRRSGSKYREGTKNESKLPIPLNDIALDIAKRNIKGKFPKDFLFIHPGTKKPYTRWFIWDIWHRLSGVEATSYEATRHSFCSNLPKLTDTRTAQRLMRHKDPRSTNNYFHAYAENLLEVVQEMDNVKRLRKAEEE